MFSLLHNIIIGVLCLAVNRPAIFLDGADRHNLVERWWAQIVHQPGNIGDDGLTLLAQIQY
jgi:hypothetical protein